MPCGSARSASMPSSTWCCAGSSGGRRGSTSTSIPICRVPGSQRRRPGATWVCCRGLTHERCAAGPACSPGGSVYYQRLLDEPPHRAPSRTSPAPGHNRQGAIPGALLRRRDRTDRPPHVEHYWAGVNESDHPAAFGCLGLVQTALLLRLHEAAF